MGPFEKQIFQLPEQRGPLKEGIETIRKSDLNLFYPVEESEEFSLF
jgi:hypothetical protein